MPALSTNEPDQNISQSIEIYNGRVVSLPRHHIGPLPKDEEGYQYILVEICAFSRWIELFTTKTTTAEETARYIHQHFGLWGTADRLRTDNGPAFANDLLKGLANLLRSTNEFAAAYSSEENGIVQRANKEVLRHLRALVFATRVKDKWSFKDLPIIQRIFNSIHKKRAVLVYHQLI